MSVFIDPQMPCLPNPRWRWGAVTHLCSDSLAELHAFAARLGLKQSWFQRKQASMPHYDLTPARREMAIKLGAIPLPRSEFVKLIRAWRVQSADCEQLPDNAMEAFGINEIKGKCMVRNAELKLGVGA